MHTAWVVLRLLGVFVLLAGVLAYLRRWDSSKLSRSRTSARPVEVLGTARLSKNASVAVVRIGDQTLALGVTDAAVNVLTEAPLVFPEPQPEAVDGTVSLTPGRRGSGAGRLPGFGEALRAQAALLRGGRITEDLSSAVTIAPVHLPPSAAPRRRATNGSVATAPARTPEH